MQNATLCVLLSGGEISLGRKKSGFGAGRYNMYGGKCKPGEDLLAAAVRELQEEAGVSTTRDMLQKRGELTFVFPSTPAWDQVVHVYFVREWVGEPQATEEMVPSWFFEEIIPYDEMWPADSYWLPRVLAGRYVTARFEYASDQTTILKRKVRSRLL